MLFLGRWVGVARTVYTLDFELSLSRSRLRSTDGNALPTTTTLHTSPKQTSAQTDGDQMSSLQKDFLKSKLSKLPQLPALRDPLADASEGDDTSPDSLLRDDDDEDERDGLGELGYVPWSTSPCCGLSC